MDAPRTKALAYRDRINRALNYIQNHIDETIGLEKLANLAFLPSQHFHDLFRAYIGETPAQYIKRLRLKNAAFRLKYTAEHVDTICSSVGFADNGYFDAEFQRVYQCSPRRYRQQGGLDDPGGSDTSYIATAKLSPSSYLQDLSQPVIKKIPAMSVIKASAYAKNTKAYEMAWQKLMLYAYQHKILNKNTTYIGKRRFNARVSMDELVHYDACISCEEEPPNSNGVQIENIQGGWVAKFLYRGAYKEHKAILDYIYREWLPGNDYGLRDAPVLSIYLNDPVSNSQANLETMIVLPIF